MKRVCTRIPIGQFNRLRSLVDAVGAKTPSSLSCICIVVVAVLAPPHPAIACLPARARIHLVRLPIPRQLLLSSSNPQGAYNNPLLGLSA